MLLMVGALSNYTCPLRIATHTRSRAAVVVLCWCLFHIPPCVRARRVVGGVSDGSVTDHGSIALDSNASEVGDFDEIDLMSLEEDIGALDNALRQPEPVAPSSHLQTLEANSSALSAKRSFSGLCEPEAGAHGGASFGCKVGCHCNFWRQCYPRFVGPEEAHHSENVGVCEVAVWVLILASLLLFAVVVGSVGMARTYLQALNAEEMDSMPPVMQK
mmetsp:Transcript_3583/g.9001  ORF Transcript_3583/g.9001 Transcript_3583/m.9001 type:complete len:216 (-) Transcript_3583:6-653(-)